jgi:hypothetical protein
VAGISAITKMLLKSAGKAAPKAISQVDEGLSSIAKPLGLEEAVEKISQSKQLRSNLVPRGRYIGKPPEVVEDTSETLIEYMPTVNEEKSISSIFNITDDILDSWKKKNQHPLRGTQRYRSPKLEKAARALDEAKTTKQVEEKLQAFKVLRDKEKGLKTYGTVPKLTEPFNLEALATEIRAAVGKKVDDKGVIGINKNIPQNKKVTSRFDIHAYDEYDKYVVTVGEGKKVLGYAPTAVLKNVEFKYFPDKAWRVTKGEHKGPFATMEGEWQNLTPESAHKLASKNIKEVDPNTGEKVWTEVGFDPSSRLSFYNRVTGDPVFEAEEVIQVGPMVLARGIKEPTKDHLDKLFFTSSAGKEIQLKKRGGMVARNPYPEARGIY